MKKRLKKKLGNVCLIQLVSASKENLDAKKSNSYLTAHVQSPLLRIYPFDAQVAIYGHIVVVPFVPRVKSSILMSADFLDTQMVEQKIYLRKSRFWISRAF